MASGCAESSVTYVDHQTRKRAVSSGSMPCCCQALGIGYGTASITHSRPIPGRIGEGGWSPPLERRAYSVHRLGHRSAALFLCYCYRSGVFRARPLRVVEGRLFFLPGPCSFISTPLFLSWSRMVFRLDVVKAKGQGQREYAGAILRPRRGGRSVEGWELCLVQRLTCRGISGRAGPFRPRGEREMGGDAFAQQWGFCPPCLMLGHLPGRGGGGSFLWDTHRWSYGRIDLLLDGFWSVRFRRIDLLLTGRCLLLLV